MTLFGITIPWIAVIIVGVVAAVVVVRLAARSISRRVRRATGAITGLNELISAARQAAVDETRDDTTPRSVSGGDSLYLPLIKKDFPDFSLNAAKEAVRAYMSERFADADGFRIHRIAIGDYLRSGSEKTVVLQCSYELREDGRLRQFRAILDYTHRQMTDEKYAAQTCPACGAAIGAGATECAYCGSRLIMTRAAWEITSAEMQ